MKFQHILVRATNWVGDAVMCIPALQALRQTFPQAHIAVLARPWVAGLYGREPFCDEVIPYEAPRGWHGWREKWDLAQALRSRNFDCAVILQNAFEAAALLRLAQIPVRIGYDRDARGWLLTDAVAVPKKGEIPPHQRFYYLELLRRAGLTGDYDTDKPIRLSGAADAAEQGSHRFRAAGLNNAVVGVSPGAAYGGAKRWLPERFAEAAVSVASERGAAVAVFGSTEERDICATVCRHIESLGQHCVDFAGLTSLPEFIEMAAACDVYLTNDSGPMHIASALGVPTAVVFGPTDEFATGPTGLTTEVVREPVECSPCLLRECPIDHRCMGRVTAQRVSAAAFHVIEVSRQQV
jgi:heptosyltransferase-2